MPRRLVWEPWGLLFTGILLWWNASQELWLLLAAAAIHEAGHCFVAGLLGQRIACMRIGLMGAHLEMEDPWMSYGKEATVAAAGALFNALAALASVALVRGGNRRALFFFCANAFLGLCNLLPARGLDGGVLLYALAAQAGGADFAYRALWWATLVSLGLCAWGTVWLMRLTGRNLSVLVLCLGLFLRLFPGKTEKRPL